MFCEYCNTQFKSTSSLNFHQKSAKYCLKIQNKNEIIEEKDKNEQCQICMKVFTKKYIFTHIQNSCITNINSFIKDLKNESNDLRNKLNEKELELQKKEREIIEDYLSTRLPLPMRNGYCWQAGEIKPRIEFLNELIKNYTETNNQINL